MVRSAPARGSASSRASSADTRELTYALVEHRPDDLLTLRGENASVISLDTMRFGATPAGGTRVTYEAEAPRRGSR